MDKQQDDLISYRVMKDSNVIHYKEMNMNNDEVIERRSIIRIILRNTSFNKLSNEQIDSIRLEKAGDGYYFEDEKGYETLIRSGVIKKEDSDFRRVRAMIPFKYIGLRGSDFNWKIYNVDVENQTRIVNGFITSFERFRKEGKGLYISSRSKGSGKTMLACCVLNELSYRYAISTKFITILDFIEITKKGFKGSTEEIESIYNSSVLVLDDIGVQMSKEWVDSVLFRLINDRYNNKRITIYTSNIPMDKLKLDERIIERIEADVFLVDMPEVSIRKIQTDTEKSKLLEEMLAKKSK